MILAGIATFAGLAFFVTPYHIIQYRDDGKTTEESRAIKREIDNAFAENAINVGRSVVRGMLARTTDPERRAELEQALSGLEEARTELRTAGAEVLRAKREALETARQQVGEVAAAVEAARNAIQDIPREARKEHETALKEAQRALREARRVEREAERALRRAERGTTIAIGPKVGDQSMVTVEIDPPAPPVPPADPADPAVPAIPATPAPPALSAPPPLPPEVANKIRRGVTGDMYRIGIGAALILLLVPLFLVAVVIKFFVDRSRASQRLAELKRKEAEYARMTQQVTEAKLSALQAQVEPHFLYNTLASVQALTEVDPARANEMTGHLIQYLRNALPKMRESVSTVGQEVELVRAYLSILQMRMGARLAFTIDVSESLAALPFPPLMLPSLVENAIKHGLEPQREGGTVHITASLDAGRLKMVVSDTGRGFSETPGAGVGLANIRERLAALYGEGARLTLEANEPRGVIATIEVPAEGTRSQAGSFAGAAAASSAAAAGPEPGRAQSGPSAPPPRPAEGPEPAPAPTAAASAIDRAAPFVEGGFWARAWEIMVKLERGWRVTLYYLFLVLMGAAAVAAIGFFIGAAAGIFPVEFGDGVVQGPMRVPMALAGSIVGFIAVALALAIVTLVLYGLGFFLFAIAIFVVFVVLISLSPVLAPIVLIGLAIWWMARKRKAPPPPQQRVEPTLAE